MARPPGANPSKRATATKNCRERKMAKAREDGREEGRKEGQEKADRLEQELEQEKLYSWRCYEENMRLVDKIAELEQKLATFSQQAQRPTDLGMHPPAYSQAQQHGSIHSELISYPETEIARSVNQNQQSAWYSESCSDYSCNELLQQAGPDLNSNGHEHTTQGNLLSPHLCQPSTSQGLGQRLPSLLRSADQPQLNRPNNFKNDSEAAQEADYDGFDHDL